MLMLDLRTLCDLFHFSVDELGGGAELCIFSLIVIIVFGDVRAFRPILLHLEIFIIALRHASESDEGRFLDVAEQSLANAARNCFHEQPVVTSFL